MRFIIVSVGWQCAEFMERTLVSIKAQSVGNWESHIRYDPSDDNGAEMIERWCDEREGFNGQINTDRRFAVRNQYEAIVAAHPAGDDIIVFLDLDGDQLAHEHVLRDLAGHYADGTLLTYGSYRPVPDPGTTDPAVPFPKDVVRNNAYRKHMLSGTGCCFNHLRTMSGRVFNAIPANYFHWSSGPKRGEWYEAGTDYIFMVAGLELAGGRYKFIPDVLLLYNHANPNADYLYHPAEADACTRQYLSRPPLSPLPPLIWSPDV